MNASAAGKEREQSVLVRKLVWFLLVIIVPIIAAALMIGIALQIVGVPVWKTTTSYLGWSGKTTTASPIADIRSQLMIEQSKVQALSADKAKLTAQLADAQQQNQQLQSQNDRLQNVVAGQQDTQAQAKHEASVLVGMDPAAAASVLGKMSTQDAAQVVAEMSAADSGAVLAALDAAKAAQILALASQISAAEASNAATAANNAASSASAANGTGIISSGGH